ncbi:hypothetical protein BKA82DRAFT_199577 [Pisolithus tinctorius]|uniref:Uncharacterized protein n=1 Tax=Pisolithus tinctorius Marx 270 TaxID=870435 RepID=A0A0C3PLB5_PISTI|nr:hypothetical protein BKA82DRAFT_199577 [Pisolithus tinctorius]KIO15075.1 hypothetical protein M404DRAFT_199577 [Pisolithus tinctorius Marx 270]
MYYLVLPVSVPTSSARETIGGARPTRLSTIPAYQPLRSCLPCSRLTPTNKLSVSSPSAPQYRTRAEIATRRHRDMTVAGGFEGFA